MEPSLVVQASIGDAYTMICADGTPYSPDLVHDMMNRAGDLLEQTLIIARNTGYIDIASDLDDVEDEDDVDDDEEEVEEDAEFRWWIQ